MDNIYGSFKQKNRGREHVLSCIAIYSAKNKYISENELYSLKLSFNPYPTKKQAQVTLSLPLRYYFSISAKTDFATISNSSGDRSVEASI